MTKRFTSCLFVAIISAFAASCSDEPTPSTSEDAGMTADAGSQPDATGVDDSGQSTDDGGTTADTGGTEDSGTTMPDVSMPGDDAGAPDMTAGVDTGPSEPCDYETVDDVLVIEAEALPINEDWAVATAEDGYTGNGYIEWTGQSHNNDPTHGVISVAVRVDTPGRYQMQWHVRIGMGTNTTEHNDAFVRFADAADFYGLKGDPGAEIRRYPRPQCEDTTFTDAKEALPNVDVADCVRSSSTDGWIKVYSSGAADWRWSTFTSDNDASDIMVEFDQAGVYTLELAARADHFLIDRIVLHRESVDNDTARNLALPATNCEE